MYIVNKILSKRIVTLFTAVVVLAAGTPLVAHGEDGGPAQAPVPPKTETSHENTPTVQPRNITPERSFAERTQSQQETARKRLDAAKLKVCQAREKEITTIMKRVGERGDKHLSFISTVAARAEAFYTRKGKTLATYDQLVSDVANKKSAAQAAVATTKASMGFSCSGDDPKGIIGTFKANIKNQEAAMKAFRASVKELIAGIKSVQGTRAVNGGDKS